MANIKDVAKKAGVSTATVSHVINGTRYVSEPTKQKVLKSMKELNYKPNIIARSLRSKESKIISFIVPDISNFFFTGIANHIEKRLKNKGYSLFLSNSNENLQQEKDLIDKINSHFIDGLIVAPCSGNHDFLKDKIQNNYPVIFIDRKPDGIKGTSILVNNEGASYEAVSKLIEKGHNKIGIITGLPGITTTHERLIGYKKAIIDHDLEIEENYIKIGDSKYNTGYKMTKKLLENTDISALFVTNNLMCVGALEYLNENNIKIPEEIAIIGFDDYKWASITNPPLSVIKQPIEKFGNKAVEELFKLLKDDTDNYFQENEVRLEAEFIQRLSC